ncbi:transporter [Solidesulfovibrio carbinoliphilus]|uniref:transporter n=1 Tax=Solidesulfovibrio carbinoliphilus TaxID=345370 RepID=UPI0001C2584C|nr:transporter [Solidesulfovibrio carbinoliphilus]
MTIPTGQFDREGVINLGSNRWSTKHEICVAKGFGDRTWLELSGYALFSFDTDNALAYMVTPNTQVMTAFSTDAATSNGIRTSNIMVRLGFIF